MSSKATGESPAHCHRCLTCKNTVVLDKDDMAIQAFDADKLSSLFAVFCDSVDILVEDTFDFKSEPFPFCKRCKLSLIKLYQLTDELNEIQGKISLIRGQFRSQMAEPVDEHESDPPSRMKRPRSSESTASKIHELRNLIYHRKLTSLCILICCHEIKFFYWELLFCVNQRVAVVIGRESCKSFYGYKKCGCCQNTKGN